MKKEKQELTTHANKATMQQELVHMVCLSVCLSVCVILAIYVYSIILCVCVIVFSMSRFTIVYMMSCVCVCVQANQKQALGAMEEEQARRIKELSALSGDEIERRVAVSDKLMSVQRELLASRKPTKVR